MVEARHYLQTKSERLAGGWKQNDSSPLKLKLCHKSNAESVLIEGHSFLKTHKIESAG